MTKEEEHDDAISEDGFMDDSDPESDEQKPKPLSTKKILLLAGIDALKAGLDSLSQSLKSGE